MTAQHKIQRLTIIAIFGIIVIYLFLDRIPYRGIWPLWGYIHNDFDWEHRPRKHRGSKVPADSLDGLPKGTPFELPRIQYDFSQDDKDEAYARTQLLRREAVRNATRKCWLSYREYAWGYDELAPISLKGVNTYSGWGATLVDSLDTLWIMGFEDEFQEAVAAVAAIDWGRTSSTSCSFFETNIRYLGGLLAAYELSEESSLLDQAKKLGHMLHAAFDTPNGMPANQIDFQKAKEGNLVAAKHEALAIPGTFSLEFTKLSQLSGDPKYYREVQAITWHMNRTQDTSRLPGMWPVFVNLRDGFQTSDNSFSLGGAADSAYEYLSKMHMLIGGLVPTYETMHRKAMRTAKDHILFRPMMPDRYPDSPPNILFSGTAYCSDKIVDLVPQLQHLGCFAGGMFAIGGKLFGIDEDVDIGEQLARGCAWAYSAFPTGVMPETSEIIHCKAGDFSPCPYDEAKAEKERHHDLPLPFHRVMDYRYLLRPEAIESVFILYRITGKKDLLDVAWAMFQSIRSGAETKLAYSSIKNVQATGQTGKLNSMESFWMAETLKYFYLIFSEPDLISLDDYVLNTEAHPLKRPKQALTTFASSSETTG